MTPASTTATTMLIYDGLLEVIAQKNQWMLGTFVYLNIIGPFITKTTVIWAVAMSVITDGRPGSKARKASPRLH